MWGGSVAREAGQARAVRMGPMDGLERDSGSVLEGPAALLRAGWRGFGGVAGPRGGRGAAGGGGWGGGWGVAAWVGCRVLHVARGRAPRRAIHDEYGYLLQGDTFVR